MDVEDENIILTSDIQLKNQTSQASQQRSSSRRKSVNLIPKRERRKSYYYNEIEKRKATSTNKSSQNNISIISPKQLPPSQIGTQSYQSTQSVIQ